MPDLILGTQSYKRGTNVLPPVVLRNMFLEASPTNLKTQVMLWPRPALRAFVTVGVGPIRGMLKQPGTLGGDTFVVSGPALYRVTDAGTVTLMGTIPDSGRVSMAASATVVMVANGTNAYSCNGVTVAPVAFPDAAGVVSVAWIQNRFLFVRANSQRFYWTEPGAITVNALNFASAESSPDNLVAVFGTGDEIWLFGEKTIEVWAPTGASDLPFQLTPGRVYDRGCLSRDSIVNMDNTLVWVGDDWIVYRAADVPQRLGTNNGVEEQIRLNGDAGLTAWSFTVDGHAFYVMTLQSLGTYAFDVSSGQWSEFASYGRTAWRASIGVPGEGVIAYAGDDETAQIWTLDSSIALDGADVIERTVTAGVPISGQRVPCSSVNLECATGTAPISTTPEMEMRYSDVEGHLWTPWQARSMGLIGQYNIRVRWTRLGLMRPPGRIFQFRTTSNVLFRISGATINEAF